VARHDEAEAATHTLQVLLRNYRGDTETLSLPVVMPAQASGPLTLLVSDAATLTGLEQRELKPGKPSSWPALLAQMNAARHNNRLYVRLIATSAGTVVAGDTLPALPASVRSVLDEDKTVASAPVANRRRRVGAVSIGPSRLARTDMTTSAIGGERREPMRVRSLLSVLVWPRSRRRSRRLARSSGPSRPRRIFFAARRMASS
jgi:hypothetical protein